MAVVFEEALKKSISNTGPLSVYLLFGDDGYLKKTYCDKLLKAVTEPDDFFNCSKFGADCDLQEVYDAVMQLPFAADKKFVLLDDFDFEHRSKNDFERLCQLLADVPDTAVLVLRFDNVEVDSKKSSKFKKIMASAEKSGGIAVKLDHRRKPELIKMLCDGAVKRGCKMESGAAEYLIETAGDDINILINELNKLCAFTGSGAVTKQTVDRVSVKTIEASVFNLTNFIISCDLSGALSYLDELFFMRVEPMTILYAISSVYVDMFRIFVAGQAGKGNRQVAETFNYGKRDFVLDKLASSLKKFDRARLDLSLDALVEADKRLKSFGADSRIVLEQLIVKLVYIIVKGESVDKA